MIILDQGRGGCFRYADLAGSGRSRRDYSYNHMPVEERQGKKVSHMVQKGPGTGMEYHRNKRGHGCGQKSDEDTPQLQLLASVRKLDEVPFRHKSMFSRTEVNQVRVLSLSGEEPG